MKIFLGQILGKSQGGGVSQFFLTVPGRGECDYQPMHYGKSEICMTVKEAALRIACLAGGICERTSGGLLPRGNSRAAKPRVKFPPATFLGNPPSIRIFGKSLFKFPPPLAEKLFKCSHPHVPSGEERGLISLTAAGNRA